MYLEHYRLNVKPFEIAPDSNFLWFGEKLHADFMTLKKVIHEDKGSVVLMGEPGTGKSTLLNGIERFLGDSYEFIKITAPSLSELDFFNWVADAFGIETAFNRREDLSIGLRRFADDPATNVRRVVLMVDDAHLASPNLLGQLRLLSTIQKEDRFLIHIVFAGPKEFDRMLRANPSFSQTPAMSYTLRPLMEMETAEYILHRLRVAGSETDIFTSNAMAEIFHFSNGIPRMINIICDNALMRGYALNTPLIGPEIIWESQGPGHRLIHEICELDKEFAAQHPVHLQTHRGQAVLAIGPPSATQKRLPGAISRRWHGLLKTLGLRPLTVKGALAAPISLFILLGVFGHFYFPKEDDEPPFTQVQIHPEHVPGRPTILPTETSSKAPSGIEGVVPVAEVQKHEGRVDRRPGLALPSNEDRGSASEINRLQGQLRFLLEQLQTALDATAQLEKRIQALEKNLHTDLNELELAKKRLGELEGEAAAKDWKLAQMEQILQTLEKDLQTQLVDLRTQRNPAPASAGASRTLLAPKRTVVRPEKRRPVQLAPTDIMDFLLREKMQ
jgi:general secretion pathway protein A